MHAARSSMFAFAVTALSLAACKDEPPANSAANNQFPQQQGGQQYPQGQYPQGQYPQGQQQYPQQGMPQQGMPQQQYPQQPQGVPQQGVPQQGVPQQPAQPGAQPQGQQGWPQIPGLPAPQGGGAAPQGGGTAPAGGGGASGGTAQPMDPNLAVAASAPLMTLGNTEAPGAQKEGNAIAGNFQQGQTLEGSFTMQPGRCYTVVAASAGIQQLDISVVALTPIPGMSPQLGSATGRAGMAGSQAVLGSKANCIKLAFTPVVEVGAGLGAAQLYVK